MSAAPGVGSYFTLVLVAASACGGRVGAANMTSAVSGSSDASMLGGACVDGQTQCVTSTPQACTGGQWVSAPPCSGNVPVCLNGGCVACNPAATATCVGNSVQTCTPSGQGQITPCTGGKPFCYQGTCTTTPPSCQSGGPGLSDCGPNRESCCTSLVVTGGPFNRSYAIADCPSGGGPGGPNPLCGIPTRMNVATLGGFRLDKYEITVGRFRPFINAVIGGWLPTSGSGKHVHLNGGQGLSDSSASAPMYESGWDPSWNGSLATSAITWNSNLTTNCVGPLGPGARTWTSSASGNDGLPINCIAWYDAYAFCIWDGGFLPSEAEWNYAASGGSEQRVFPWSSPPGSTTIDCSYANYGACVSPPMGSTNNVGSESPIGDGRWGQTDLGGNVDEWTLDGHADYVTPCADCAYLDATTGRVFRGGDFLAGAVYLTSGERDNVSTRLIPS
jgi:formylglycine-generating enzyme